MDTSFSFGERRKKKLPNQSGGSAPRNGAAGAQVYFALWDLEWLGATYKSEAKRS